MATNTLLQHLKHYVENWGEVNRQNPRRGLKGIYESKRNRIQSSKTLKASTTLKKTDKETQREEKRREEKRRGEKRGKKSKH
jgi:hypothetical protein